MKDLQKFYDEKGNLQAVLISAALWERVRNYLPEVDDEKKQVPREFPEPLNDWEQLKDYWDFQYPVCTDVVCDNCGNATSDWENDTPRKFKLRAANIGGQVGFECTSCGARVLKRHFKDHMAFECRPMLEND